jgi:hypothetical protein
MRRLAAQIAGCRDRWNSVEVERLDWWMPGWTRMGSLREWFPYRYDYQQILLFLNGT